MSLNGEKKAALTAAMMIPLVEASIGTNWLPTLIICLGAYILTICLSYIGKPKWFRIPEIIILILLIPFLLKDVHQSWPSRGTEYAVPFVIIALALYAAVKKRGLRCAAVLRYGIYGVLLTLGYGAIANIEIKELLPRAEYANMKLAIILLIPMLIEEGGEGVPKGIYLFPITSSFLTANQTGRTLYQFSKGIAIHGIAEHFESITACASFAGYFALTALLLEEAAKRIEKGKEWKIPLIATIGYAAILM